MRAIESLRCCDEIVVVDSGSNDRTVELAANLGARVIENPWHGYASQKNFASEQAANDWILSIDADESLSEALEGEIWQIKKNGPRYDAYTVPRLAQYLGRWILHSGWYPDRKVRLFNRTRGRWTGDYVHESVQVDGRIGHLKSNLLHFTCSSLSEHLKSMDRPTTSPGRADLAEDSRFAALRPRAVCRAGVPQKNMGIRCAILSRSHNRQVSGRALRNAAPDRHGGRDARGAARIPPSCQVRRARAA